MMVQSVIVLWKPLSSSVSWDAHDRVVTPCGLAFPRVDRHSESIMGYARSERERRSNHRVDLDGRAVLFQRGDHVGQYTIENLSAGGAWISGNRELRPGHLVHLLIDLEESGDTMSLTGSVRRAGPHDNGNGHRVGLAIAFPALSADQEDAIHDALLRGLVRRDKSTEPLPFLVFEPRRRVREEIESEVRSFGLPLLSVDSLSEAVEELESDDTKYGGLIIHSVTHDRRAMDVVEFFARSDGLRTIILPEPQGSLSDHALRLAKLPFVVVPPIWSRSELRRALMN